MTKKEVIDLITKVEVEEINYLEKKTNCYLEDKEANASTNGLENYTKYMRDYFPELQGLPYCCAFQYWCFAKAFGVSNANKILGVKTAKCSYLMEHMQLVPIEQAQDGDLVFFKNSQCEINHIGFLDNIGDNIMRTIEGNTTRNDNGILKYGVFSKYYNIQNERIAAIGRPNYNLLITEEDNIINSYNAEVNAYNVNVRNGAGTEYRKLGMVTKGYKFKIISTIKDKNFKDRNWYKFEYNNIIGYICADYIKKI